MILDYTPKRPMMPHQEEAFVRSADLPAFALLCEQRTRKTKIIIDTAARLYQQGKVNLLIVIAMPGRVHANWVRYELPEDLPDGTPLFAHSWDSGKAGSRATQEALEALRGFPGLAVLTLNGEAVITPRFRLALKKLLDQRPSMLVLDEFSLIIPRPGNKRSMVLRNVAKHPNVRYRRILDGTPAETPLGLYMPFTFLDPKILGFTSHVAFKQRYARWKKQVNHNTDTVYDTLDRGEDGTEDPYVNLDELYAKIAPYSYRITRAELGARDVKVFQKHTFRLTNVQRAVYDRLAVQFEAELAGGTVTARHALTRILRLQQVASNFWPPEKVGVVHPLCNGEGCPACDDLGVTVETTGVKVIDKAHDPRAEALAEVLSVNRGIPTVIWARFHRDVDAAMDVCYRAGGRYTMRYDGRTSDADKDLAQTMFQSGRIDTIVGNPKSGGRGLRLDRAGLIIFYSNMFSLLTRLQSQDRADDLDRTAPIDVVDLIAEDTVDDTLIVPALRSKKRIMDYVMQERGGSWL